MVNLFRYPRSRKISDFYQNYDFTLFQKIEIFWGLTISVENRKFSISQMMKQTSPLNSSHEI